jgi:hypothetical protein
MRREGQINYSRVGSCSRRSSKSVADIFSEAFASSSQRAVPTLKRRDGLKEIIGDRLNLCREEQRGTPHQNAQRNRGGNQRRDVERVMEPALFTAERYRHEAARVRRAVMAMRDQLVRRGMFSVADQYDGLAEFVERRRFPQSLLHKILGGIHAEDGFVRCLAGSNGYLCSC